MQQYQASLAIRQTLSASDPTNTVWQRDLSISYEKIADILQVDGDLAGALQHYQLNFNTAETLSASDPTNAEWQTDLAASYLNMASVSPQDALTWYRKAHQVLLALDQTDRLPPRFQTVLQKLDGTLSE